MIDSFGRNITYMRISVTELCNLRCRYCMPADGVCKKTHEEMLTEDEMITAVEAAASLGITKLRITGGEPLVKKNIVSICRRAKQVPGILEICITTNGTLLPDMAVPLLKAGVGRVNISLDTVNPGVFRKITGRDCLDRVLTGLDDAVSAGFRSVKINTVLLHGLNDDGHSIRELAELACRYSVDLRFIELMPVARNDFSYRKYFSDKSAVFRALPELMPCPEDDAGSGVAKMFRISGASGRIGVISPVTDKFCRSCNRIRITSDGKLRPCLLSPVEYSLRGLAVEDIERKIRLCVEHKPQEHSLAPDPEQTERHGQIRLNMQRIGG